MARRINPELAAFIDPGPAGDLIRLDRRPWRSVIGDALEVATDPRKRPDDVRLAIVQILWLAEAADRIRDHWFPTEGDVKHG